LKEQKAAYGQETVEVKGGHSGGSYSKYAWKHSMAYHASEQDVNTHL
jgi:hypothetical protein